MAFTQSLYLGNINNYSLQPRLPDLYDNSKTFSETNNYKLNKPNPYQQDIPTSYYPPPSYHPSQGSAYLYKSFSPGTNPGGHTSYSFYNPSNRLSQTSIYSYPLQPIRDYSSRGQYNTNTNFSSSHQSRDSFSSKNSHYYD